LALLSYDVKPVLCIFGLNLSGAIISTLIGADVKRVIISLNRDDDPRKGQAAADKIANKLGNFFTDVRVVLPPEGTKDWGAAAEKRDDSAFARFREENGL
jgi:DNA primase